MNSNLFPNELRGDFGETALEIANRASVTLGTGIFPELFPRLSGESDDTKRLQRAIDEAQHSKTGIVRFTALVYSISQTLNIPSGVKFMGLGWERRTNGLGTIIRRTTNTTTFKAVGQSVLSQTPDHIQNVEFSNIRFEGGDFSADFMQFYACSLLRFENCQFYGMKGRQLLFTEVMDSRLYDCSFEWGGSSDGTLPSVELASGVNGYEYTNQIHFFGCRWESYRGTAIAATGTNTNECFFFGCKLESLQSVQIPLKLTNTSQMDFDVLQITSKGTSDKAATIPSLVSLVGSNGLRGNFLVEHLAEAPGTDGAGLTTYIDVKTSDSFKIDIHVNKGVDVITSSVCVQVDGTSNFPDRYAISGTIKNGSTANKVITNAPEYHNSLWIDGYSESYFAFKNRSINPYQAVYFGRLSDDGNGNIKARVMYNNAGSEHPSLEFRMRGEVAAMRNLTLYENLLLAQLNTPAVNAREGAMYCDTSVTPNAVRVYSGGAWRRIAWSSSAPSSGAWNVGDMIYNTTPSVQGTAGSQYVISGWICTSQGSPGTWQQMRMLTGS